MEEARDPKTQALTLGAVVTEGPPAPAAPVAFEEVPGPSDPGSEEMLAAIPADAQSAFCECGAELLVSRADAGRTVQCPACSLVMEVQDQGSEGLRLRGLGRMEDGTWSLDDFHEPNSGKETGRA